MSEQEELIIRAIDEMEVTEERTFTGLAMPWNSPTLIREQNGVEYREQFAKDSIVFEEKIMVFSQHKEPVGIIEKTESREDGFYVSGKVSRTRAGDDILTLVRDGVVTGLSVGFSREGLEDSFDEDTNTVTRNRALIKEISFVSLPAYKSAKVLSVRSDDEDLEIRENDSSQINNKLPMEVTMSEQNSELEQRLTSEIENIREETQREIAQAVESFKTSEAPAVDTRSAGEVLKSIASGNELDIRVYSGGTSADASLTNQWVGDLTRIIEETGALKSVFAKGQLPSSGLTLEYAQLLANTVQVTKQDAEGDDLDSGNVTTEIKTAPIYTYGGYSRLTRQEIERSSINILDHHLRAQAVAIGQRMTTVLRTSYLAQHALQITATNTVDVDAWESFGGWIDALIDASVKFETLGLPLEALLCDVGTFKALAAIEGADGRPMLVFSGSNGNNTIGSLNVRGLSGNLASLPVIVDSGQNTTGKAAFINSNAIRQYSSSVVKLQNENIINLSKDFALYQYAALADEIPAAIVPVVFDVTSS